MVGRELVHTQCPERRPGDLVLQVRDLGVPGAASGVSFDLRAGEVLGLAGLMGCGSSEVMQALFGLQPSRPGSAVLGKAIATGPRRAIRSGLGFVPNDRKRTGILPDLSVMHNVTIGILGASAAAVDRRATRASVTEGYRQSLSIRCHDSERR